MTENKIKYNSYENSFYINDDEGISQIIAPELIIEIINDYEKEIVKLKQKNKELEELVSEVDNELEIRDIVCRAGKFRLEEWGKHRYHQFYKGDEELEDETVVIMLMELEKENNELEQLIDLFAQDICDLTELLCKNNIDYKLHSDVTNFIVKWGIMND